ncbi:MAG: GntR family transcriptional regulator [Roseobacter sp.]
MYTPLEKSKAATERVAAILRDRIIKGDLAPMDRIVERRLSAELDVSRTPVREALKLLEADGLIQITLHRGALVSEYRSEDASRLFDVISVLESLAARRFAETMTPTLLDQLEGLHRKMLDHHTAQEFESYFDVNTDIHDLIVENCGNPVIADTHRRLIARARRGRFLAIMDPERLAQAVNEHECLMQALRRADPSVAAETWETHLRNTGKTLATVLSAQERESED